MRWLLWLVVPLAVHCGGGQSATERSLLLWHSMRGVQEDAFVELARMYEASHGVRIEMLSIPFDAFAAKVEAAVPHGHGPDVFIDAHERLGSYARKRVIAAAGDAMPDEDVAAYDPVSVEAVTVGGVRYGVPLARKCLALYVNEALVGNVPESLEQLLARPRPGNVYGLAYGPTAYFHAPILHAFGGRLLTDDGHFGFVGQEAEASLLFARALLSKKVVPEETSGALIQQLFQSGKVAAAIDGPWLASDLPAGLPYRIVPLPRLEATGGKLRPFLTVDAAFLTPLGATRPEVRAFMRWLGSAEAARIRVRIGRQVPATRAVFDEPGATNDAVVAAFDVAAREALPMPTSPAMRTVWLPAEQAIRKVMRGDASPHDATAEAARRFDDAMKAPPPPPSPLAAVMALGVLMLASAWFLVQRARRPDFSRSLAASKEAYRYVAHAAVVVFLLVVFPLLCGAATSLFVGTMDEPRYVGFSNYISILTSRGGDLFGHGSFYLTLLVTILWTLLNVTFHVALGVILGLALAAPLGKVRAVYRVLLILPWAVPSYVTALAWKGMFHRQFGAMNAIIQFFGGEPIAFFARFSTAFTANLLTNVWLGFPFMVVVTLGALTTIPSEVLEAAEVDGATRWQRFWRVTLPLLRPSLLPAVVLGAVWTFNMFNVVYLVSGGEPDGATDILVTEAYRWAFTRDAQYGYAAAYSVLIFGVLALVTGLLRRVSRVAT